MNIVSLFSGAGGLDLGLMWAGHKIVWANDIFGDAVQTYKNNISDHVCIEDITQVSSTKIPECDVVVGGFPCQGFSVANWGRTEADPRNHLYQQMVRIIRDKQPKYFVAENVKGLVSMAKGAVLNRILDEFSSAGYNVKHAVVNAADYGVPQARKRLLIVGSRRDLEPVTDFPPPITHTDPTTAAFMGLPCWKTVGEALAHLPEPHLGTHIPNHTHSKYKLLFNGHLGHRTIDPKKPSPTITARGDEKGGVVVLHHPSNLRRMTARELAAVQSFPDNFEFFGTRTSAYRQIANAVPPPLGYAVGRMLANLSSKQYEVDLMSST